MALNGYVTAEQRKCRLVKTSKGLVTVFKLAVEDYEVYVEGVKIGRVFKCIKSWFPDIPEQNATVGDGGLWPQKTRQAAIEWVMKHGTQPN